MEYRGINKISFCTVCMNRLHHLQQTLPKNIADNADYKNLEFIVLDYNSTDGLEEFVRINLKEHVDSGKLVYYKTVTPRHFERSHSRNLAFRLACGDILCNVDADNFTGKNFATYLNTEFQKNDHVFFTAIGSQKATQDVLGRVCVKKEHFYKLTGYDEHMSWYGFEDHDFTNRLELNNIARMHIPGNYLSAITHEQKERLSNESLSAGLIAIYVCYLSPASTEFLFLFQSNICRKGILINNGAFSYPEPLTGLKKSQLNYEYSIYEDIWAKGKWYGNSQKIIIQTATGSMTLNFDKERKCMIKESNMAGKEFYHLTDPDLIQDAIMFFSQVSNRIIMAGNKLEKRIAVNDDFGKDMVYKNFNYPEPILI